ncbi:MAG: carboxylating nicotinate-nucleotide diphosphorylase [Bacteroidales bacterium]|nr:carboxylating nicotinate-nucleotide diphosphorylase [Bacteroidales bacterium]
MKQMTDYIDQLIDLAIAEDIGDGDHTSLSCIPNNEQGQVQLLVKEKGILAGVEITERIIKKIDPNLKIKIFIKDGTRIKPGDIAFKISGNVISILQAERLLLNFMQRMSGIATQTAGYADLIKDLPTKVLDTRKTTPGLRHIEKLAVETGGGTNHRMGLYDMVMLKDNHIDFAGGIEKAVLKVNKYLKQKNKDIRIEVEVRDFKELEKVLRVGKIHRIMLDNFTVEDTKKAVKIISGKYEVESSGGITLDTLRSYAECGVDFISVGALTHQIKSLDLSLKAI